LLRKACIMAEDTELPWGGKGRSLRPPGPDLKRHRGQ
jgi:hypothetical protein